ncbi:UNVERIFIED_CONTAM: hypothetical protein Sradi_5423000 [Sesamum radiatum]|uniref:Uncharacterized protein n=1 Tax=Sesamum radiatum TaxID=300843 RepID=A0AAW2L9D3_SESRA
MAGMLPGVEAARRRRFHNSNPIDGAGASTTRPSSFLFVCKQLLTSTQHLSLLFHGEESGRGGEAGCCGERSKEEIGSQTAHLFEIGDQEVLMAY